MARIPNYRKLIDFEIDQRILDAMKKAGDAFVEETYRRGRTAGGFDWVIFDEIDDNYVNRQCRCTINYHEDIDPEIEYEAKQIQPSLFTWFGWSGIWNCLNTAQRINVLRFLYNVDNAEIIE